MKYQNIIRLLAGLSFLIFFCPFFQMCSDDMILKKESETEEQLAQRKKDITFNAYELSYAKQLNSDDTLESSWPDIFFTVIILSSIIAFIRSFRDDASGIRFFYYLNILLAIGFVFSMIITAVMDDISQIKYGFYLFLINTFAIIILCKKQYNSLN